MKRLTVAIAQINSVVGALVPNADKILRFALQARAAGANVAVFPAMSLTGHPLEDLVLKPHFLEDCGGEIARLAARLPPEMMVVLGAPQRPTDPGACPWHAAFVFQGGFVRGVARKIRLSRVVCDEARVFAPGSHPTVARVNGSAIGIHLGEDSWAVQELPCKAFGVGRLDLLLNLSASPYHRGQVPQRRAAIAAVARAVDAPVVFCNLVGGQDELVFDGGSFAMAPGGEWLARAQRFKEDLCLVDFPIRYRAEDMQFPEADVIELPELGEGTSVPQRSWAEWPDGPEEVYRALVLGLQDYVNKNGFRKVVVGLSGGIDSALVAVLACDALGPERVVGVSMPTRFSSAETRADATALARNLGIEFREISIDRLFQTFLDELQLQWSGREPDTTEENLQARIRGVVLMALSNKFGWLVLATGNKSEVATGYCTLYGDTVGGFAVLKDVPKTLVYELARWRNARQAVIPQGCLERAPSAELRPGQKDTDSLPPYEVLDPILERYVEQDQSFDQIVRAGFDPMLVRRVIRMVDGSEYKRRQGAPGVKITPRAFGQDRRMPITNLYQERL